jgi:hypothetical protein
VERRLGLVEAVEVERGARRRGARVVEEVPVEARLVVPLLPLRQLAAHEQQLLARLRPHVAVEQPQVGELLPVVARHLASSEPLPCTTSSCDSGSTKFSEKA